MSRPDDLAVRGRIFDIQRFSIHDGPGIRTTVFFSGCPLRCVWCHNPEGMSMEPMLSFLADRCIGCGYCFGACPDQAHATDDGRHILNRDRCKVCGSCVEKCYAEALEIIGRDLSVEDVLDEVQRDRPFYETSGGGMTLSGGEPLLQINFAEALLQAVKDEGLHCCIDTCGFVDFACLERVLPYVDLFLYDVKDMNEERHVEHTGASNRPILDNLRWLHDRGAAILLRLPLIPGCNDRADHFRGIADLVAELPNLVGVEVLPYHRLGLAKRERLGIGGEGAPTPAPPDTDTVSAWISELTGLGVHLRNANRQEISAAPDST